MLGYDEINAMQFGSETFDEADWVAVHEDDFGHVGVGVVLREIGGKADLRFDYSRGEGSTDISVSSQSGGLSALPALDSTLDSLQAELRYRWSDRLDVTLDLRYESFNAADWALQDVAPDTLPTVLTMGATPYDYDVWLFGLGFRYLVGRGEIEFPE